MLTTTSQTVTYGDGGPLWFGFGTFFLFFVAAVLLVCVIPFWKIFRKAGFPGALALLMPVPFVNLVLLYILAFTDWPSLRRKEPPQDVL